MSDFDEEAERERLREKYERDQRKREATEQMSDLLLKGATMTNSHCSDCGDPIFRYDGREFCPTCQRVVEEETDAGEEPAHGTDAEAVEDAAEASPAGAADSDSGATDGASGEDGDAREHIEVKRPTGPAAAPADAVDEEAVQSTAEADVDGGPNTTESGGDAAGGADAAGPVGAPSGDAHAGATPGTGGVSRQSGSGTVPTPDEGEASLSAARQSLVRTLTVQARLAEGCEDPRQTRDHLEAAREAAETLAALSS